MKQSTNTLPCTKCCESKLQKKITKIWLHLFDQIGNFLIDNHCFNIIFHLLPITIKDEGYHSSRFFSNNRFLLLL